MTQFNRCILSGFVVVALLISSPLRADVVNGSFENFFNDWTTVGPNTATAGPIGGASPTDGNLMAHLNTGAGALPLAVHAFVIESDLGLNPGDFSSLVNGFNNNATEGATLYQTFFLDDSFGPDCTVSFDWNFLTNETPGDQVFNDFAFYAVLDSSNSLVASGSLNVASASFGAGGGDYAAQTGWIPVSIGGLVGGQDLTLIFGVFDVEDTSVTSGLLVDNIRAVCVPEPSSALLLGLASVSAVGLRRRRN